MVHVLDYDSVKNDLELKSRYYVHFRSNTLGEGMKTHYLSDTG